jgi:hypothetical protein
VAIDPQAPPSAVPSDRVPAIENEIPTYRAIHPPAVISLVLGILSILSFAHPAFVLAGLAAILTGVVATRTIRRLADVLTGSGLAQAGIALGLIFSLSSVTVILVQSFLLTRDIQQFAARYCQTLTSGNKDETYFLCLPPALRAGKAPKEAIDMITAGMPHGNEEFTMRYDAYKKVLDRMTTPGQAARVDALEGKGVDGVTPFGTVRLRLTGPAQQGKWETEEFALILIRGAAEHGRTEWYVEELRYPYQPSSYAPQPKPIDDGHDHGH